MITDFDTRTLMPMLDFASDFFRAMVKDDQMDLAFPNRRHRGRIHHFHYGLVGGFATNLFRELLGVYEVIKQERFRHDDTVGTFIQRCISIHKNEYNEEDRARDKVRSDTRVELLNDYLNQLRGSNKSDLERKVENAIYMGKLQLKSQRQQQQQQQQQRPRQKTIIVKKVKPRFPKPLPPPPSSGKIKLYSTGNE